MPDSNQTTIVSYARKVRAMRAAQKEYFRTRDQTVLRQSKALEREVDAQTEAIINPQMELG